MTLESPGPFTVGVLGAGHVGGAITNALVLLGGAVDPCPHLTMGTGTMLRTARLRHRLGQDLEVLFSSPRAGSTPS